MRLVRLLYNLSIEAGCLFRVMDDVKEIKVCRVVGHQLCCSSEMGAKVIIRSIRVLDGGLLTGDIEFYPSKEVSM
jgi:hypothetical protein